MQCDCMLVYVWVPAFVCHVLCVCVSMVSPLADSKVLTAEQREQLFQSINSSSSFLGWKVEVLSPSHISNCMLQR